MILKKIKVNQLDFNTGQIAGLPKNPRFIRDDKFAALKTSIEDSPEMMNLREIIAVQQKDRLVVIGGNMRLRACIDLGWKEVPCKILPETTEAKKLREYVIKDNLAYGQDNYEDIANEWDLDELKHFGYDVPDYLTAETSDINEVTDFEQSINFIIKCTSIDELDELKTKLNTDANRISYQDFLIKAAL